MSEIRYSWVEEQVGTLKDKTPNDRSWIINSLSQMKDGKIRNAQDVFVVQNALKSLGYKPGKLDAIYRNADKKYDSHTMMAVRKFQEDNNLRQDGQVGPETIGKLLEKLGTNMATEKASEKSKVEIKAPEVKAPEELKKVEERTKKEKVKILQENATKVSTLKSELIKSQDGKLLNGEVSELDMTGKLSSQELGNSIYFDGSIENGEMITGTLYSTKGRFTGLFKDNKPFDGFTVGKDGNSSTYENGHFVTKNNKGVEETQEIRQSVTGVIAPRIVQKNESVKITQHSNKNEEEKKVKDTKVSIKDGTIMKGNEPLTGTVTSVRLGEKNTIPGLGNKLSFSGKVVDGKPVEGNLFSENESFTGTLKEGKPFEGTIKGADGLVLGNYKQGKPEMIPVLLEETRKNFIIKNGVILRGGKPFTGTVEALEPKEGKLFIENLAGVKDFIGSIRDGKLEQGFCSLDGNGTFRGTFTNNKAFNGEAEWKNGELTVTRKYINGVPQADEIKN